MKVLLIDNYDSFTFMLKDYIEQCDAVCRVVRNDQLEAIVIREYEAVVISPGPSRPSDAHGMVQALPRILGHIPVLGICLGHQAIGTYYGAMLEKAVLPKHGKVEEMVHDNDPLFTGIPIRFSATRYHSLVLTSIPSDLQVIAVSQGGEVMAVAHKKLPVWGVQFHPESCMTPSGLRIIANFLKQAKQC